VLFSLGGRHTLRNWIYRLRLRGRGLQKVLVVGRTDAAVTVIEKLDHEPQHGLVAVGACVPSPGTSPSHVHGVPVVGAPTQILQAVDEVNAHVVAVVSHPDLSGHALRRLAWALEERQVELVVSPGIIEVAGPRLSIRPVAGLSLLHLERPAINGGGMITKFIFDKLFGVALLVLFAPLLLLIAAAVKLTSVGPVLFRQTRIGIDGAEFTMYKFRSMAVDAEQRLAALRARDEGNGMLFKMKRDPRVTRVGAIIRRLSLDELPQLWNILRGDMSLVGPRPPLPEEVAAYSDDATRRLRVRPGLTGLWQVSGRSDLSWEESLRLDLRYVDNWSLALDLAILWRTLRAVIQGSGAY
jgi:exopolysaccharide biosynthesis polyprenyl glycosylphosphotransferase